MKRVWPATGCLALQHVDGHAWGDHYTGCMRGVVKGDHHLYPREYWHGTEVQLAESILWEGSLRRGTATTGGMAGLWHGDSQTAVSYAVPGHFGGSKSACCAVFRIRVSEHTRFRSGRDIFVCRDAGTYTPVVLMIGRYTGRMDPRSIRGLFNEVCHEKLVLADM